MYSDGLRKTPVVYSVVHASFFPAQMSRSLVEKHTAKVEWQIGEINLLILCCCFRFQQFAVRVEGIGDQEEAVCL